jgi:hypothetical protein
MLNMKTRLFFLAAATLFLGACTNPLANLNLAKKSGLQVTSIPQATVFLDGNALGTTPVREEDLAPGVHTIRLVPQDPTLLPYEAEIKLTPGVLTAIDRTLAASPEDAHGFTLSFEPLGNKREVIVDITTIPESATISVNNTPQGFTPKSLDTVTAGDHVILLSSPGFIDKTVRAKAVDGHRLTISVQLARAPVPSLPISQEATGSATPSAELSPEVSPTPTTRALSPTPTPTVAGSQTATEKPYVKIEETGTGWLRVRTSPPGGEEVARVNVGETFPYLDSSQGWYQIEYAAGKEGWVSSQYATLVE